MKNYRIFAKDWLLLHPYKQSGEADLYYTRIANQIFNIMVGTSMANTFTPAELNQVCLRLAAYFEDVISGLNIWRSFSNEHKRQQGTYVPFYATNDNYYDDEVNVEDIRFLLWHYLQQYHGAHEGTFVNPDNPIIETTAQQIYQLFCDEWEVAPENPKMQALFAPETTYQTAEEYQALLFWFHYYSYLFTDTQDRLNEALKHYWKQSEENRRDSQAILTVHSSLAYIDRTSFLAYTSPKWLSLILPETHPSHSFFVEQAERTENFIDPILQERLEANKAIYDKYVAIADGKLLHYMSSKEEFIDFATNQLGMEEDAYQPLADAITFNQFAVYASPKEGLQLLFEGIEYIKDEANLFYNEKKATNQALAFFFVKHCSMDLLRALEERGMLADAQTKNRNVPERGKTVVHENWEFLAKYFIRELV